MSSFEDVLYDYIRPISIGVANLIVLVIATIWCLSLKGIFKEKIKLQRKIFIFIALTALMRTLQNMIYNTMCPEGNLNSFCKKQYYNGHDYGLYFSIAQLWMVADILSSTFNFTIYATLTAFWAEQYYMMKNTIGIPIIAPTLKSTQGLKNQVKLRKVVDIFFWVVIIFVYILAGVFILLGFTTDMANNIGYYIPRLIFRFLLSSTASIALFLYGGLFQIQFKQSYQSGNRLWKIILITIICGGSYALLSLYNLVTFFVFRVGEVVAQKWIKFILYVAVSLIELGANGFFLLVLTPERIKTCCGLLKKRRQEGNAEFGSIPNMEHGEYHEYKDDEDVPMPLNNIQNKYTRDPYSLSPSTYTIGDSNSFVNNMSNSPYYSKSDLQYVSDD